MAPLPRKTSYVTRVALQRCPTLRMRKRKFMVAQIEKGSTSLVRLFRRDGAAKTPFKVRLLTEIYLDTWRSTKKTAPRPYRAGYCKSNWYYRSWLRCFFRYWASSILTMLSSICRAVQLRGKYLRMALTSMRTRSRWLAFISLMMSKMASGVSSAFRESLLGEVGQLVTGNRHIRVFGQERSRKPLIFLAF